MLKALELRIPASRLQASANILAFSTSVTSISARPSSIRSGLDLSLISARAQPDLVSTSTRSLRELNSIDAMCATCFSEIAIHPSERAAPIREDRALVRQFVNAGVHNETIGRRMSRRLGFDGVHENECEGSINKENRMFATRARRNGQVFDVTVGHHPRRWRWPIQLPQDLRRSARSGMWCFGDGLAK